MNTSKGRNVVVVGTQWGDEGKGKLVDWLTESANASHLHNGVSRRCAACLGLMISDPMTGGAICERGSLIPLLMQSTISGP